MNLIQAMLSGKRFTEVEFYEPIQYFTKGTGPYKYQFDCGYFVVDGEGCTTLAFYGDEILAQYRLIE